MGAAVPAGARFLVRLGQLTFAERMLDSLALVGFDAFGIAAMGCPGLIGPSCVLEIVDRCDDRIVWRTRDEMEALGLVRDLIRRDLSELEVASFAARWSLP